jgi:hypothetical protein
MPRYAILADHSPDICPGSNAKTRARASEAAGPENIQRIAGNLGLSFVLEPQHLDPTHRVIAVVDAPSIEAANQFVFDTGLFQWNTVETFPLTPIGEMMPKLFDAPVVYD